LTFAGAEDKAKLRISSMTEIFIRRVEFLFEDVELP
jgi:hypothetical protein